MKKEGILPFLTTWVKGKHIMLSETIQTERETDFLIREVSALLLQTPNWLNQARPDYQDILLYLSSAMM